MTPRRAFLLGTLFGLGIGLLVGMYVGFTSRIIRKPAPWAVRSAK